MNLGIGEQVDQSLLCFLQRIDFVERQTQGRLQGRITGLRVAGQIFAIAPGRGT
ncbi:hypothetical protein D3C81_2252190 [compost metagenome]